MVKDIIQPKPEDRRKHDPKLLAPFSKFVPEPDPEAVYGTSGNLQFVFEPYSLKGGTQSLIHNGQERFYDLVSAPMLLTRLVAAGFSPIVEGQEGYKCTWRVQMRHKETGHLLTLYDYKGGSSYGSDDAFLKCEQSKADALEVLKALIDARFPHPYDGCCVGEIA